MGGIDEDAYCTICWVSGLGAEPCIKLGCGHVFHMNCIKTIIETKWTTPHISFGFMNCPSCKQPMDLEHCELLQPQLQAVKEIKENVEKLAVERAKFEGLD